MQKMSRIGNSRGRRRLSRPIQRAREVRHQRRVGGLVRPFLAHWGHLAMGEFLEHSFPEHRVRRRDSSDPRPPAAPRPSSCRRRGTPRSTALGQPPDPEPAPLLRPISAPRWQPAFAKTGRASRGAWGEWTVQTSARNRKANIGRSRWIFRSGAGRTRTLCSAAPSRSRMLVTLKNAPRNDTDGWSGVSPLRLPVRCGRRRWKAEGGRTSQQRGDTLLHLDTLSPRPLS